MMVDKLKTGLIIFGIIDSLYLLINTYLQSLSEFCPLQGCYFLTYYGINFPALLGLIWFVLYPFMRGLLLSLWQVSAIIGIAVLGGTAILTSYFCPYCFAAYTAGIGVIAIDRINR
jgi:hypothetical protein